LLLYFTTFCFSLTGLLYTVTLQVESGPPEYNLWRYLKQIFYRLDTKETNFAASSTNPPIHRHLTVIFRVNLGQLVPCRLSASTCLRTVPSRMCGTGLLPAGCPFFHPTSSFNVQKERQSSLIPTNGLASSFLHPLLDS